MNNDSFTLSCPSKTFICGEYLVLTGGAALVINTLPRFELIVTPGTANKVIGIPEKSPAYKLLQEQAEHLENYQLEFKDPHAGRGGFGASSAQFLLVAKLIDDLKIPQLLATYHQYSWNGKGIKPSGADIIAQLFGQITYYHPIENLIETFAWPFTDIDFLLLRTQNKIATHDHLNTLPQTKITAFASVTNPMMQKIMSACSEKNSAQFIQSINAFAEALKQHDLVTSTTKKLLNKLYQQDFCLAAKGCGAMGADVILVLCDSEKRATLTQWCVEQSIEIVATNEDICGGLESPLLTSPHDKKQSGERNKKNPLITSKNRHALRRNNFCRPSGTGMCQPIAWMQLRLQKLFLRKACFNSKVKNEMV